jgi:hypothetical protein
LLSSVALVDGGAILSCHEELPDRYLLTCKDKYAIFGLQCFAGAAESLVPSAVRLEYFTVNCLVETEWSSAGNGLLLRCLRYDERSLEFFRRNATKYSNTLIEGRIPTLNCSSTKIDIDPETLVTTRSRELSR